MEIQKPRLKYIYERYCKVLSDEITSRYPYWLAKEDIIATLTRDYFLEFVEADPTRNKSATQWLIETYLQDGYLLEDLKGGMTSKVHNTLLTFGLYRKYLEPVDRSLTRYKSLAYLWNSVKDFIPKETDEPITLEGRALKRAERERAYQESEIIHQADSGFILVSPKTHYASQWWGRGTRWCTASENNSMFDQYNNKAPLLIIIMPNGDKCQLQVTEDNFQFMDASDKSVTREYTTEHWNTLKFLIEWSLSKSALAIKYIPSEFCSEAISLNAVTRNGDMLKYVPDSQRTKSLCYIAFKNSAIAFRYMPDKLKNQDICELALKHSSLLLEKVPYNYQNYEMCLNAVKANGLNLKFVHDPIKDRAMCEIAVNDNDKALEYVPDRFIDTKICLQALKYSHIMLKKLLDRFENLSNENFLLDMIKQNGNCLEYVPENLLSHDIFLEAVRQNGYSLRFVEPSKRNREICMEAIKINGNTLQYVPKEHQDRDLLFEAVRRNGDALQYVPEVYRDRELCWEAVKKNGIALEYVPKEHQDRELCLEAVRQSCFALKFTPEVYRDKELCLQAVKQNGCALKYAPDIYRNRDLYLEAVKKNGNAIFFMLTTELDRDLCLYAVRENGGALRYVPEAFQDRSLCVEAVRNRGDALIYVPEIFRDKEMFMETIKQEGIDLNEYPDIITSEVARNRKICRLAKYHNNSANKLIPKEIQKEVYMDIIKLNIDKLENIKTVNNFSFDILMQSSLPFKPIELNLINHDIFFKDLYRPE